MRDRDPLRSRVFSILFIALFFMVLYIIKGGFLFPYKPSRYLTGEEQILDPKIYIQIEGEDSGVYAFPMQEGVSLRDVLKRSGGDITLLNRTGDAILKNGSRVVVKPDNSIEIGLMHGEKLILFDIPIDINRAQIKDLEALPGIGKVLAERIVETRDFLDGFSSVDDLTKVKGIGEKKLKEIADFVTVEG